MIQVLWKWNKSLASSWLSHKLSHNRLAVTFSLVVSSLFTPLPRRLTPLFLVYLPFDQLNSPTTRLHMGV